MSKVFKPRRGSANQVAAFVGEANEVILNTTTNTLHVMDGLTAGGFPLARADEVAKKDAEQDEAIAKKALSFEVDGLDLVITYGNGTTERVKLPTGKGVGDLWCGHDPKSVPANVQLYSGQLLSRAAYEAHSDLVFSGKRTVVTESEWQSYAGAHDGMCPYYSSGDGSTTYRMPCIKGVHPKFVAALAEAGQYVAAGLPNITGRQTLASADNQSMLTDSFEGAFYNNYRAKEYKGYYLGSGGMTRSQDLSLRFDASIVSTIYGNSTTVQPPALTFLLGEYVVGSVAVVGEADAESLLEAINAKADADVGGKGVVRSVNGVSADAAGNVSDIDSSGSNWIRYTNGLQICWGDDATHNSYTSFPKPFSKKPEVIACHAMGSVNGGAAPCGVWVEGTTRFYYKDYESGNHGRWIAIGYWK